MANENIKKSFKNIADAIREKKGSSNTMTAEEMPGEIATIQTGITPTGTISITENDWAVNVTNYAYANVNVGLPKFIMFDNYDDCNYVGDDKLVLENRIVHEGLTSLGISIITSASTLPENYSKSDIDNILESNYVNITSDSNYGLLMIVPGYYVTSATGDLGANVQITLAYVPWADDYDKADACAEFIKSTYSDGIVVKDICGKTIDTLTWDDVELNVTNQVS